MVMNEVWIVRLNLIYLLYIIVVKNTVIIKIWIWNTSNNISDNEFFSITLIGIVSSIVDRERINYNYDV